MMRLPDGPLLAFYGDDFTGSTDAMEVMAFAGLPTVLFLRPPSPERLAQFSDRRGLGIAGLARSKSPTWMDLHLPSSFRALFGLGAPLTQYKVCSTFDSAPDVGSVGRAIDLGLPLANEAWAPLVVGAPQLRRWQAFGNLFAGHSAGRYRLDRHPTMAHHPITPMHESDLALHLARQTARRSAVVDLVDLKAGEGSAALAAARQQGAELIFFDVADAGTQAEVGRIIWENRGQGLFSASSSGLQYALVAHWRAAELLPARPSPLPQPRAAGPLLVVSGSCSPGTAAQISAAEAAGFVCMRLDGLRIADPATREAEIAAGLDQADIALRSGRDALVYTARSPDDPAIGELSRFCTENRLSLEAAREALGSALGNIAAIAVRQHGLRRLIVAGGDTSGHVLSQLPVDALEAISPLAPGSPVCKAHSEETAFADLELVLKGGQVGGADLFVQAKGNRD